MSEDWDQKMSALAQVAPRGDFVRRLGQEIGRTARERAGYNAVRAFDERVIELRRLVRLLRQTLRPVQPRPAYRQALAEQLYTSALRVTVQPGRMRWLVIGSAIGSLLSLIGVLTALLLRQRRTHPRSNTPLRSHQVEPGRAI